MLSSNLLFKIESGDFLMMIQRSTLQSNDVLTQSCFRYTIGRAIFLRHFVLIVQKTDNMEAQLQCAVAVLSLHSRKKALFTYNSSL
jgi:hypothetical protein